MTKNRISDFFIVNGLPKVLEFERIFGGANNKIFRVRTDKGDFLLKVYFKHQDDQRDRLKSEFSFCKFAWEKGLRSLPQPVTCDFKNQMALYEFIEGRHLRTEEVTPELIFCALNFYQELNNYKRCKDAEGLAVASEACFSIEEHLMCFENRLEKLRNIEKSSEINLVALDFVNGQLLKEWQKVRVSIVNKVKDYGFSLDEKIRNEDRCLSPSDFGFHNAILSNEGRLRFIDFEYAGWDDPAKMVCDFFCQPKIAVPLAYFSTFMNEVISTLPQPERVMQRIITLFPLYQLKWCFILLNDFLPTAGYRRRFAFETKSNDEFKIRQLLKARQFFKNLIHSDYNQLLIKNKIFDVEVHG